MSKDKHYIACCRFIVDVLGKNKDVEYSGGCPINNCRVYEDDSVLIVCSKVNYEFGLTKKDNVNPVLMTDEKGEIYRSHGEIRYLKEHIYYLVNEALANLEI